MQKSLARLVFFALYVLCTYLVGSLLAYPVARILVLFNGQIDFAKVLHYVILLFGLLCSLFYLRFLTGNILIGLGFTLHLPAAFMRLLLGILQGLAIFAILQAALFVLGLSQFKPGVTLDILWMLTVLGKGLLVGLLVSLIEESIFRGALLRGLEISCPQWLAIAICSLLFSVAHFVEPPNLSIAQLQVWSGITLLFQGFGPLTEMGMHSAFTTLFLVGFFLCVVRVRTGELLSCIGIHAGLVAGVKLSGKLISYQPYSHAWVSSNGTNGLLPSLWFLFLIIVYLKFKRNEVYTGR